MSSQVAKWQLAVSSGPVTKLVLGEGEDVLYCATEDGGLRAVDTRTGAAVGEWRLVLQTVGGWMEMSV